MATDPNETVARLSKQIDRMLEAPATNSSASNINIQAGGIGLWIAVTMCACMFVMNLCLLAMIVNHDRKIDDLGDYIHAIYMAAPSLKPEKKT